MRKMLSDQEREDIAKRQAKVEAGKRYQRELDAQLTELRTRSFNSLASKLGFILFSAQRTWLLYIYIYIYIYICYYYRCYYCECDCY